MINRMTVLINNIISAVSIIVATNATELGPGYGVGHHLDGGPIICHGHQHTLQSVQQARLAQSK